MSTITLSKDFCFNFKNDISILETHNILKEYPERFKKAFELTSQHPIFLDTNILLNYYGMSTTDKNSLKNFFQEKISILHITQQIEKEFQRNRISTIEDYFDELKKIKANFKTDLQEGIKNKFNNIRQSKIVAKDYPEIMSAVEKIYQQLEKKLFNNGDLEHLVNTKIDSTIGEQSDLEYVDPILDIYKNFIRTPDLSDEELLFLNESYSDNVQIYSSATEQNKLKLSFPGCGEKKDRDPSGDYIIFHEIIKFMRMNSKDAIFLTRDVTKSDWLQKNRKQFIHYIEKVYQLTGHYLFIIDATDLLSRISFENIYQVDSYSEESFEKEDLFRARFSEIVKSISNHFQNNFFDEGDNIIIVENRRINNFDIDLVIERQKGYTEGVLVYNCGSTKKGYRASLQKRINACNNLVEAGIVDIASLVVCVKNERFDRDFDYGKLNTKYPIKIYVGVSMDNYSFFEHIRLIRLNHSR